MFWIKMAFSPPRDQEVPFCGVLPVFIGRTPFPSVQLEIAGFFFFDFLFPTSTKPALCVEKVILSFLSGKVELKYFIPPLFVFFFCPTHGCRLEGPAPFPFLFFWRREIFLLLLLKNKSPPLLLPMEVLFRM